jgi:UDP-N-acetylmuramyl pentapeptide synthase
MKVSAAAAKEAGMPEHSVASFSSAEEAGHFLQEKMQTGDVILIKGSRAMHMEKIVKEVMAEPLRAGELLV